MNHPVIEWAPFTLTDGVDAGTLLAASEALQSEFLGKQPGFLKRELVRLDQNHWVDIVYWKDKEAVERAMQNVASSPVCFQYFHLMVGADHDQPGEGVMLYEHVKSYEQPKATG
jgi:hypothetical protein